VSQTHADKPSFWSSYRNQRIALWVGLAILAVGAAVASFAFFRNTGHSQETPLSNQPANIYKPQKQVKVDSAARRVAGEFILTAVSRKNLAKSYDYVHPELRQGMTRKQWATGDIPVVYYPAKVLDKTAFKVDESYENEIYMEVALLPKAGSGWKPQIFYIGLKRVGGKKGPWAVNYWVPRARPELPTNRD
jgi:hypothetical protein